MNKLSRSSNELEIVEFTIEENLPDGSTYASHYGINVAKVLEIIRLPQVTSMPSDHDPSVLGTFNLRGKVLPILDLANWLGKQLVVLPNNKVIITEFSGVQAAFMVSSVSSIHRLTWDMVEPPNKYVRGFSRDCITGVTRVADNLLFILDMEKILSGLDSNLDMSRIEVDTSHIADASQFHVLVADDSSSLRNVIKSSLEKSGYKVTAASSGQEAWEILCGLHEQAQEEQVDVTSLIQLVISDIEMPQMDGHTLTLKIRETSGLQKLPVILFSSLITEAIHARGIKVGADRQVSKPDLATLNSIVRDVIAEKLNL